MQQFINLSFVCFLYFAFQCSLHVLLFGFDVFLLYCNANSSVICMLNDYLFKTHTEKKLKLKLTLYLLPILSKLYLMSVTIKHYILSESQFCNFLM